VPAPRLAAADEDTGDPGTPAPGPARISLGAPRAAPRPQARVAAEEDLVAQDAGDEDELESEGSGVAVGSGLRVKRGATAASSAPRLTDDEPLAVPTQEEPATLVPAGDDGRVETLLKDAGGHSARGDLTRAIQAFTDVLDLRHDRADAYIGRGRCYLELGDYSSAMSDFQRAEDLWPNRPDPHVAMGDLYYNRKEYRRAIEFYDHAVEFDSSHAMARCRRGISHYYRKNFRQAFQDLQRAYQLDPDIPNIRKYVQMAVKKMERGE
jgi:tetratricopeptide (TPR) repeat protein